MRQRQGVSEDMAEGIKESGERNEEEAELIDMAEVTASIDPRYQ